jgi:NDP-4-keto-2,6-dideoxyhexose 3-C-methyltransferase
LSAAPFRAIEACRICGSTELEPAVNLGEQALTGIFPRAKNTPITRGPLELVKCSGAGACGLVQLRHTYDANEMYGAEYGYRSSLNRSMVEHLGSKVRALLQHSPVGAGDVVLDIGSNDGTTLGFYPEAATLIGIDPTAAKFAKYYKKHIHVVADFFSQAAFLRASGGKQAKIVTSISMFYDLDRPLDFMREVHAVLAEGGTWHFEQSYLSAMLAANSYDTICHEHLEYYALAQIVWMADRVGFSIRDVTLNDTNGGSFAVTAVKVKPGSSQHVESVAQLLAEETRAGLQGLEPFVRFAEKVRRHRGELRQLLEGYKRDGKRVFGMGASTKGNVLLQYCGIDTDLVSCIAEVNADKFGCFTPGTGIPIVSEADALAQKPDVFLVLPWHFRENIIRRATPMLESGVTLLFPLPTIELYPSA